jgi:hypothetical protein
MAESYPKAHDGKMIFTFTDFGLAGPYLGQVKAVLWQTAPDVPVFDLFADAPDRRPREAAYLLAAYAKALPHDALILGVVDPGVGGDRPGVALKLDGRWFVGPGNGLFEIAQRRATRVESYGIAELPPDLSTSFHGRDLFAPLVGKLAAGWRPDEIGLEQGEQPRFPDWPDDLPVIVYQDIYGNLMTGLRSAGLPRTVRIGIGGRQVAWARTFSAVEEGAAFWYGNANGLVEIAVNGGSAAVLLAAGIGSKLEII